MNHSCLKSCLTWLPFFSDDKDDQLSLVSREESDDEANKNGDHQRPPLAAGGDNLDNRSEIASSEGDNSSMDSDSDSESGSGEWLSFPGSFIETKSIYYIFDLVNF